MLAIVTGGFGFIGSHLCRLLSEAGHKFIVVDACTQAAVNTEAVQRLPGYTGCAFQRVENADTWVNLSGFQPDVVFHLAAETHVDRSLGLNPTTLRPTGGDGLDALYQSNVVGTARAARYAREKKARFIHWSTDEVYGDRASRVLADGLRDGVMFPGDVPAARESDPFQPSSPYSASKAAAECAVSAEVRLGLEAVVLRPSNAYGPGQSVDKLIPVAITYLGNRFQVPLYGGGYQVRQWIHAEDIARFAMLAVERPSRVPPGAYNLGGPDRLQNDELVHRLHDATSRRGMSVLGSLVRMVEDRPGHDVAYSVTSCKARSAGWSCRYTLAGELDNLLDAYLPKEP